MARELMARAPCCVSLVKEGLQVAHRIQFAHMPEEQAPQDEISVHFVDHRPHLFQKLTKTHTLEHLLNLRLRHVCAKHVKPAGSFPLQLFLHSPAMAFAARCNG